MGQIPKIKSLSELKMLISNYRGVLSDDNLKIINEIIREMEQGGGKRANKDNLKKLMNRLAGNNGVKVPKK